ncbi:MAG: alpha/beta fold hydrolase [Chloroflexi bacterium]|nr:alpha/beta fold hydrolase [Chloroflexota bacterium]
MHYVIIYVSVWLLTIFMPTPLLPAQTSNFISSECTASVAIDRTVECGTIKVPLNHDDTSKGTASLPIMVVKSNSETNAAPLYLLQGGPGGDTIETFAFLASKVDSLLPDDRDIVFYEQRGTTDATPALDCPESHELGISLLREDISYGEAMDKYTDAYNQCIDRLRGEGVDFSLFNSRQNALDTIYIAEQLGHEQIDLYGVSYGSLLAQHITRLKPSLIRSLVIDGVVPVSVSFNDRVYESRHNAFTAILNDCANDATCAASYPNLVQTYTEIMASFAKEPRLWQISDPADPTITKSVRVDNFVLQGWLFNWMYDDQIVRFIPMLLTQIANNQTDQVRTFASFIVFNDGLAEMMYMSTICSEESSVETRYILPEGNLLPPMEGELENDPKFRLTICVMSEVKPLDASMLVPFTTDVPMLIVSGRYDPITPPLFGDMVAQNNPDATHIVIPNGAHGAMLSNACAADIAKAFWANPTGTLDTSCVAGERTNFVEPNEIIETTFISQSAQLVEDVLFTWVILGSSYVVLLLAFFARIARTFIRWIRGKAAPVWQVRQQHWSQMLVIISGVTLTSYLLWELFWLTARVDYALFFGIPDAAMTIQYGVMVFVGITVINLLSAMIASRTRQMAWYSSFFSGFILMSSVGLTIAFYLIGIY